jgi:Glyoxalase superfamily protein
MIIMDFNFTRVVPVLRIFDIVKADEFYLGFLGFSVDWDHRFAPDAPLYRQISWSNLILHLSEHHGDGSPGARIRVMMDGIEAFHHEISSKGYAICGPDSKLRPGGRSRLG